jgi:hypothetical protein
VVGEGRRGGGGARSRRSRSGRRRRHGKWARSVAGVGGKGSSSESSDLRRVDSLAEDNVQKLPRNLNEFGGMFDALKFYKKQWHVLHQRIQNKCFSQLL